MEATNTTPKVSLVSTFYNCEAYVARCVDSLLDQEGFDDYEVVLVDDGSTDGTAKILDGYATDARVRVFHTPNGGTSAARNFGISRAKGGFISLVDGDDYVSPHYLELLVRAQEESGCRLVVGGYVLAGADGASPEWKDDLRDLKLDRRDAVEALLYEDHQVTEAPWGKLADRSIYQHISFPPGRMYEDVAVAGRMYLGEEQVCVLSTPVYAYVMHEGSVVHKKVASKRQVDDFEWATNELLSPIREAYPELEAGIVYRESLELLRMWSVVNRLPDGEPKELCKKGLRDKLRKNLQVIQEDARAPKGNKQRMRLLIRAPFLYNIAIAIYERVKKG